MVDRPFPAAVDDTDTTGPTWTAADLRFERWHGHGRWRVRDVERGLPDAWRMRHDGLTFELRPTESGQVGFFADQVANWQWLRQQLAGRPAAPAVLNLFAYTGGSTLAAAMAGASVTHVDASRPAVAWARRNAELSGLAEAPIRWIVDDALGFVERELRRGRRYDGIVLDPPSYGHGPGGRRWLLEDQLPVLLRACAGLLAADDGFVLLTAHTTGLDADALGEALGDALRAGRRPGADRVVAEPLEVRASTGRVARAGSVARWPA